MQLPLFEREISVHDLNIYLGMCWEYSILLRFEDGHSFESSRNILFEFDGHRSCGFRLQFEFIFTQITDVNVQQESGEIKGDDGG